jgi:ABC-type dipeptide/oligopeptide/nickel transport system permease subunit
MSQAQPLAPAAALNPPRRRAWSNPNSAFRRMLRTKTAALGMLFLTFTVLAAIFAPVLTPYDPNATMPGTAKGPTLDHPLGQDLLGRDQLSRLLYGARSSLAVSVLAISIGAVAGVTIGLLAAYFRGIVDNVLMRIIDALLSMPGLLLPLALLASLGPGIRTVSLALGIGFTPTIARLMRAQSLSVMSRDYVLAANALGASNVRMMLRHVAPNCFAPIIVQASLGMGVAVIAEASLSFLGVGITPPTSTWGVMLTEAFTNIRTLPWLTFAPGAAIFLLVLSINFVGDALRDVLDPRLRGAL